MTELSSMPFPVESFTMKGVYGYKNLSMNMKGKTTIFVSENGSGKTTILNALNYLLKGEYSKLKTISFSEIELKINGRDEVFKFSRDSIKDTPIEIKDNIFDRLGLMEVDFWDSFQIDDVINAINGYIHPSTTYIRDDAILSSLYNLSRYQMQDFMDSIRELKVTLESIDLKQYGVLGELSSYLVGYEVIYLPTYRRVEKSFDRDIKVDARRRNMARREKENILTKIESLMD